MPSVVVRQTVNHLLETAYLKGAIDRTRPSQVYIDITSRCNCRCVMCHVWKSEPSDELSTRQWIDILHDIARWPGPGTKVNISSGEPLLRAEQRHERHAARSLEGRAGRTHAKGDPHVHTQLRAHLPAQPLALRKGSALPAAAATVERNTNPSGVNGTG